MNKQTGFDRILKEQLEKNSAKFFEASQKQIIGVALVVHGLNLNPQAMDEICLLLQSKGISSLRITLSGHDGNSAAMKTASREEWLQILFVNYSILLNYSLENGVPIYLVGYSLGAVLGLDLANSAKYAGVKFAASVLFAPALTPRFLGKVIKFLSPFKFLVIPSINTKEFRANRGTAIGAYLGLFDSMEATLNSGLANSSEPTLVFVSKSDELIDIDGLKDICKRYSNLNWEIVEINTNDKMKKKLAHHLIITSKAMNEAQWNDIATRMFKLFGIKCV